MDLEAIADPLAVLDEWRSEATTRGVLLPEAMTLATLGLDGTPRARVVLFKGRAGRDVHFFTNYESDKGRELAREPRASVVVHYPLLGVQARAEGQVVRMSAVASDAYFATRPRLSQLGAWASEQSRPLSDHSELEEKVREVTARFQGGPVPRPEHWGGYALSVAQIELWLDHAGRLHERARYQFTDGCWCAQRLWP
jgi:pyridoxamine 5'-phosphate oxidase